MVHGGHDGGVLGVEDERAQCRGVEVGKASSVRRGVAHETADCGQARGVCGGDEGREGRGEETKRRLREGAAEEGIEERTSWR